MRPRTLTVALSLLLASAAYAQTGWTITGALSNFDCSNRCDYDCDEMEIDIDGIQPEDVLHTYRNGNYGSPSVTLSPDGTYTIIDYRNPSHRTAVGAIEHFGVSLRGAVYYGYQPVHPTRIRWYRDGHPATVNGQIPDPSGGGSAPATQPLQPSIFASVTPGSHGTGGLTLTVVNNDPTQCIWVKRSAVVTPNPVTLEDLMPDHPIITGSVQIDSGLVYMLPGATLTLAEDLIEVESDQNAVFSARYFQNLTGGGPFNQNSPGPELGNVMTATQASFQQPCDHHPASIVSQPASVTQDEGTRVDLRVQARGDDTSPLEYQWMHEGVPMTDGNGVSGTTTSHLRIDHLTAAGEGFYNVRVTNTCISALSNAALVFITGHNLAPIHAPPCVLDFNQDGNADQDDVAYLINVVGGGANTTGLDPDFNQDGNIDQDDVASLVSAIAGTGCP